MLKTNPHSQFSWINDSPWSYPNRKCCTRSWRDSRCRCWCWRRRQGRSARTRNPPTRCRCRWRSRSSSARTLENNSPSFFWVKPSLKRAWARARRPGTNFRLTVNKPWAQGSASLISIKAQSKLELLFLKEKRSGSNQVQRIFAKTQARLGSTLKARLWLKKMGTFHL